MVKDNKIEFLLIAQIQGIVFNPLLPKGIERQLSWPVQRQLPWPVDANIFT